MACSGSHAQGHIWQKTNSAYQHKHLVKHGNRGVMICACFTAAGSEHPAAIESAMNS